MEIPWTPPKDDCSTCQDDMATTATAPPNKSTLQHFLGLDKGHSLGVSPASTSASDKENQCSDDRFEVLGSDDEDDTATTRSDPQQLTSCDFENASPVGGRSGRSDGHNNNNDDDDDDDDSELSAPEALSLDLVPIKYHRTDQHARRRRRRRRRRRAKAKRRSSVQARPGFQQRYLAPRGSARTKRAGGRPDHHGAAARAPPPLRVHRTAGPSNATKEPPCSPPPPFPGTSLRQRSHNKKKKKLGHTPPPRTPPAPAAPRRRPSSAASRGGTAGKLACRHLQAPGRCRRGGKRCAMVYRHRSETVKLLPPRLSSQLGDGPSASSVISITTSAAPPPTARSATASDSSSSSSSSQAFSLSTPGVAAPVCSAPSSPLPARELSGGHLMSAAAAGPWHRGGGGQHCKPGRHKSSLLRTTAHVNVITSWKKKKKKKKSKHRAVGTSAAKKRVCRHLALAGWCSRSGQDYCPLVYQHSSRRVTADWMDTWD